MNTPADDPMDKLNPIIDISIPLHPKMPKWPGSDGINIQRIKRLELGDGVNISTLECDLHVGTHVDAPLHYIEAGSAVETLSLDMLTGPAVVAAVPDTKIVTAKHLASIGFPSKTKRLLLRTRNSDLWKSKGSKFREDYTALSPDAAQWLVDQKIGLIGIDYLSIQIFNDPPTAHEILLKEKIIILEGLNLFDVESGEYELICLPIRIVGTEGAPARAILRRIPADSDRLI